MPCDYIFHANMQHFIQKSSCIKLKDVIYFFRVANGFELGSDGYKKIFIANILKKYYFGSCFLLM